LQHSDGANVVACYDRVEFGSRTPLRGQVAQSTKEDPLLLVLPFYFVIAVGLAALVALPQVRQSTYDWLRSLSRHVAGRAAGLNRRTAGMVSGTTSRANRSVGTFASTLARHRLMLFAVVTLTALPSLAVYLLDRHPSFEYEDKLVAPDAKTQALLTGEQLVPPPPLPPQVFTTSEVQQVRPYLGGASRDWNLLDPDFRQRLLLVYKIMHEQYGYEMALLEGYRSPERQTQLAAEGKHVSNAKAFQSYHQFGLAADNAFLRDGKLVISEKDPWAMRGYQLYGQTAESVGLTWGGSWKMMDLGHVEFHKPGFKLSDHAHPNVEHSELPPVPR
jgi:peptidoglycan L-alanyl-D-glutamate endopeptidase CwlK